MNVSLEDKVDETHILKKSFSKKWWRSQIKYLLVDVGCIGDSRSLVMMSGNHQNHRIVKLTLKDMLKLTMKLGKINVR